MNQSMDGMERMEKIYEWKRAMGWNEGMWRDGDAWISKRSDGEGNID